jgi:hypothetical protein
VGHGCAGVQQRRQVRELKAPRQPADVCSMWQQLLPDLPAAAPKVARIAAWTGWCGRCGDERPLVLTETGPRGPLAWLQGARPEDRALLLTCRLCGVGQQVPRDEADDPEPVAALPADAWPADTWAADTGPAEASAAHPPAASRRTAADSAADEQTTDVLALAHHAAAGPTGVEDPGAGQGHEQVWDGDPGRTDWAAHDPAAQGWAEQDDEDDHLVPGMRTPDEVGRRWATPEPAPEPAPGAVPGHGPARAAAWSDPVDDELARLLPGLVRTTPSALPAAAHPAPLPPAEPAVGAARATAVPGLAPAAALPVPRAAEPHDDQDDEAVLELLGEGLDLLAP